MSIARRFKWFYLPVGVLCVGIGAVGVFLPVVPTTPFLILAAGCFARSSEKMERRLLSHPRFGCMLRVWREKGAIPRGAKRLAVAGCAIGFSLFVWRGDASLAFTLCVVAIIVTGLSYVLTRPDN